MLVMIKGILSGLLIIASTVTFAESTQSLDLLKDKVEQHVLNELASYTEGKIQVSAERIDPRLTLKECSEDQLLIFNPYQTPTLNSNTMGIKCKEETNHWTLYIPIKITVLKTIYVAKRPLLKGTRVTEADIYQTELDAQKLKQGYFTDSSAVIGQVCKQNISADAPLNPYNIELPKMVHKGQQVTITASNEGLSISMSGIAMNDGALGEIVQVKNLSSKKVIEAQVAGEKKVSVIL